MKWKTINNPEYIPGKSNPLEIDIYTWVEDEKDDTGDSSNLGTINKEI